VCPNGVGVRVEHVDDHEWEKRRKDRDFRLVELVADDEPLTPGEQEILKLIAQGTPTREVSEAIGLPLDEVQEMVSGIFARLRVATPDPDPSPSLPPAVSSALGVPSQRDFPRHVGRTLPRRRNKPT
jgi:DNA-binding CsgD family transcriptional regulator